MELKDRGNNDYDLFRDPDLALIERVREGMTVVDATGEHVGTVEFVRMGGPQATTVGADQPGDGGFVEDIAEAFGYDEEPDLPPSLRARLTRVGFIKIDGSGLTDSDHYAMADKITEVTGDTVRLSVEKGNLLDEE